MDATTAAQLLRENLIELADLVGLGQDVLQLHLHLHHILSSEEDRFGT